jgi:hypothetical protein
MRALIAGLALAGCGGGMTSNPPDMARTDAQVCDDSCAALIACGVLYDNTCSGNCQTKAPVFLACARAAGNDCKKLALCTFQQFSSSYCGGSSGVPQGTGTCKAQAECNGVCIDQKSGLPCFCACAAAMSPDKALNALIDSQCSNTRCAAPCAMSAASCAACQSQNCATQAAQCASN